MIWAILGGFHILDVPQGKAVLTNWSNPSYVHGVIMPTNGPIEVVPPTDHFANQKHMERMPNWPRTDPKFGSRYASAFRAAMAYVEWRLGVWEEAEPERHTLWDRLTHDLPGPRP